MKRHIQRRPSRIVGGKNTKPPDSEPRDVSVGRNSQWCTCRNGERICDSGECFHVVLNELCAGSRSIQVLAIIREFIEMSG